MLTVVVISHFYITWEISEPFSCRDLKPMAFLAVQEITESKEWCAWWIINCNRGSGIYFSERKKYSCKVNAEGESMSFMWKRMK